MASHAGGEGGGAVVADLNISIIYDQPVSGSEPPSARRRGGPDLIRSSKKWKNTRRGGCRWTRTSLGSETDLSSPDAHESMKPSLVYPQSSHCHISAPAKAFRNKSWLLEVVGGGDLQGLSKYWLWGGMGGGIGVGEQSREAGEFTT